MNLFQSGGPSHFKIEMDALVPEDWLTLAQMIVARAPKFSDVIGVSRCGMKLAVPLRSYATTDEWHHRLVVCDVWTTGVSILAMMQPRDLGFCVFARNPIPERFNVKALFTMLPTNE